MDKVKKKNQYSPHGPDSTEQSFHHFTKSFQYIFRLTNVFSVHVVIKAEAVSRRVGDAVRVFGCHVKCGAQQSGHVALFTWSGGLDVHIETWRKQKSQLDKLIFVIQYKCQYKLWIFHVSWNVTINTSRVTIIQMLPTVKMNSTTPGLVCERFCTSSVCLHTDIKYIVQLTPIISKANVSKCLFRGRIMNRPRESIMVM